MGRRKIKIEPIIEDKHRSVTFTKRKNGLVKKAMELSILCNAEIALLIFDADGKLYQYSTGGVEEFMRTYNNSSAQPSEDRMNRDYNSSFGGKGGGGGGGGRRGKHDSDDDSDSPEPAPQPTVTASGRSVRNTAEMRRAVVQPSAQREEVPAEPNRRHSAPSFEPRYSTRYSQVDAQAQHAQQMAHHQLQMQNPHEPRGTKRGQQAMQSHDSPQMYPEMYRGDFAHPGFWTPPSGHYPNMMPMGSPGMGSMFPSSQAAQAAAAAAAQQAALRNKKGLTISIPEEQQKVETMTAAAASTGLTPMMMSPPSIPSHLNSAPGATPTRAVAMDGGSRLPNDLDTAVFYPEGAPFGESSPYPVSAYRTYLHQEPVASPTSVSNLISPKDEDVPTQANKRKRLNNGTPARQ